MQLLWDTLYPSSFPLAEFLLYTFTGFTKKDTSFSKFKNTPDLHGNDRESKINQNINFKYWETLRLELIKERF